MSIYLPPCLVYLSVYISAFLSCLSVCLSICLPILSICLSIYLPPYLVYLCVCLSAFYLVYLSFCSSIALAFPPHFINKTILHHKITCLSSIVNDDHEGLYHRIIFYYTLARNEVNHYWTNNNLKSFWTKNKLNMFC
jgi:hypothetical protein